MKINFFISASVLTWGIAITPTAQAGPNPLVIEGSNYIGGCVTGLRRVDGRKHCPPDNPDGGRTPPGYFWDPTRTDGVALGQTVRPDRTGAYIRIVQTGQHCSGSNMVFTYNNGDTVDQGYSSACVAAVSGSAGGSGDSSGGSGSSSGAGVGYLGADGQLHTGRTDASPVCGGGCTQVGTTVEADDATAAQQQQQQVDGPAPEGEPTDGESDSENGSETSTSDSSGSTSDSSGSTSDSSGSTSDSSGSTSDSSGSTSDSSGSSDSGGGSD